jgi:hypothetical protein
MVTNRIFFFHNPKAGGTSLRRAIEMRDPGIRVSPLIENNIRDHARIGGRYSDFRGYDLYAGHYGRDVFDTVSDGHVCITNFRHPVTRLLSLYYYFRDVIRLDINQLPEDHYAVTVAQSADFHTFVTCPDPRLEVYTCNQHFRQLTGSPWRLTDSADMRGAIRFVGEMPCYYVCEFPQLSMMWLREALGIQAMPWENVVGKAADATIDGATYRAVCSRNSLDLMLYEHAVKRLLANPWCQMATRHSHILDRLQTLASRTRWALPASG